MAAQYRRTSVLAQDLMQPQSVEGGSLDTTPVIVGVAWVTPRIPNDGSIPQSILDTSEQMSRQAARDTGLPEQTIIKEITGVDSAIGESKRIFPNIPKSLGNGLGVRPDAVHLQRAMGGDMVQAVINIFADRIAKGQMTGLVLCA